MNVPKINRVVPLDNLKIRAYFETGEIKELDISKYFDKFPIFRELESQKLFNNVKVDCGGFGIAWNDKIDLDRYDIWDFGVNVG